MITPLHEAAEEVRRALIRKQRVEAFLVGDSLTHMPAGTTLDRVEAYDRAVHELDEALAAFEQAQRQEQRQAARARG